MTSHRHTLFLGSSSESMWFAREIEVTLQAFKTIEIDAWYHFGSWPAGASTLETLEARLRESDFAVLVLSEDDMTQSRSDPARPAPRDNVVFELGLFMGRLGRDRAFFLFPATHGFKMPSDLFGITAFPYQLDDRTKVQRIVSPLCTQIVNQIEKVVHQRHARDMQPRPQLVLKVKFPADTGQAGKPSYLSADEVSILKVRVSIDDDEVDDLRVYFDPRLNLRKATWAFEEDTRGRYFWASRPQVEDMKAGGGFLSFDVERPRKGSHPLEVVALIGGDAKYEKKYVVNVQ